MNRAIVDQNRRSSMRRRSCSRRHRLLAQRLEIVALDTQDQFARRVLVEHVGHGHVNRRHLHDQLLARTNRQRVSVTHHPAEQRLAHVVRYAWLGETGFPVEVTAVAAGVIGSGGTSPVAVTRSIDLSGGALPLRLLLWLSHLHGHPDVVGRDIHLGEMDVEREAVVWQQDRGDLRRRG